MMRNLRYALRTLAAPWLTVLAIGIEVTFFLQRGTPWLGEGLWTVDWFAISLLIIGPLCAGIAATDAARLSRPETMHLVVAIPRPSYVYLRAAMWCAGPLIALHILAIVVGLILGQVDRPSVSWGSLVLAALVQCLAIVWFTALGSAIGRFLNPLLAGIAGGSAGFVLTYLLGGPLGSEPAFSLLDLGGATITMIGKDFNLTYLAGQAVILTGTAALMLCLPLRAKAGSPVSPVSLGSALLVVAIVAVSPAVLPSHRYLDAPGEPSYCVGEAPEVCLFYEHRRYEKLVLPRIDLLMQAAREHGYHGFIPEKIIEESRSYRPSGKNALSLWLVLQPWIASGASSDSFSLRDDG